jgi:hypothetical protein
MCRYVMPGNQQPKTPGPPELSPGTKEHMLKRGRQLWMTCGGAAAGLLVWGYDYDFFLNAGGPAAPISEAILRISHLQGAKFPVAALWPMMVLVILGAGLGFAAGSCLQSFEP